MAKVESFYQVNGTLSAALAAAGTITLSYPEGTDASTFRFSAGHSMAVLNNNNYVSPKDFELTFGASNITLTWRSSVTLAAGSDFSVQLETAGGGDILAEKLPSRLGHRQQAQRARQLYPVIMDLGAPDTADPNGICESQSVTVATSPLAELDGALANTAGTVATFDVPRNVVAAWTGTAVLTVTGTDEYGNTMVEASASGTSLTGAKAFKTVTSLSFSADVTSMTAGTGEVIGLPVFLPDESLVRAVMLNGNVIDFGNGRVAVPFEIPATEYAAGTSIFVTSPVDGFIVGVETVVTTATTGDQTLTVELGTTAVDGLSVAIAGSSAVDTKDSDTASYRHATAAVDKGDGIELVITSTPSAGAVNGHIIIETDGPTAGTLVAGVDLVATATTGDVRGTFTPEVVANGTNHYQLIADLLDPGYLGATQYTG